MVPFHLCTGKVNPFPRALQFSYLGPNPLLIYGSANRLVISSWTGQLIQEISLGEEKNHIQAVAMSMATGKIAIGYGQTIQLFSIDSCLAKRSSQDLSWEHETTIAIGDRVKGVSWFDNDKLLVSGDTLRIMEVFDGQWTTVWQERCASEIYLAESSPDSRWIGVTSKYDRLVKIWAPNIGYQLKDLPRKFGYIKHPRAVTNIGWHKGLSGGGLPIMFTSCLDGIFRAWAPTNPKNPTQFYLCSTVEPNPFAPEVDGLAKSHRAPLHWVDSTVVADLANEEILRRETHQKASPEEAHLTIFASELICLKELVEDPVTLLFQIQADGALAVWKLEGLTKFPRSTPKAYNVARIPAAVLPYNQVSFFGACFVIASPSSMQLKDSPYPMEFSILVQNQDLEMDHYTLNFSEVVLGNQGGNELCNLFTWTGHRSPVLQMVSSTVPRLQEPCFATRTANEIGFWRVNFFPDSIQSLKQTHMAFHSNLITDMAWVTSGCLAVADSDSCHIYCTQEDGSCSKFTLESPFPISCLDRLVVSPKEGVFFLLGECSLKKEVFEWQIDPSDGANVKASFQQRRNVPESVAMYGWKADPLNKEHPFSLISYSSETKRLSCLELKDWKEVSTYAPSVPFPDTMVCGPDGLVLLGNSLCKDVGRMVVIDTLLADFGIITELPVEWSYGNSPNKSIKAISWLPSCMGNPVLGIATLDSIELFRRRECSWERISTMEMPTWITTACGRDVQLSGFVFSPDGSINVCIDGLVACLGKWIMDEDASNSRIPHHHPDFFVQLIQWGDSDLINKLLMHIEDSITHQDIISDSVNLMVPPLPLESFFPEDSTEKASGLESLFTLGNDTRRELSDYQITSLCDALKSHPVEGLTVLERTRLVSIIKMFFTCKPLRSSVDSLGFQFLLEAHLAYADHTCIPSGSLLAAFHSTMQEVLLTACLTLVTRQNPNQPILWPAFKSFGMSYWIRDDSILRREAEVLARNQYLRDKDPVECSLIYLALDKKRLLLSLWKTATFHSDHSVMVKFLSNDFSLERWRTAAQKNAFKLIGKQRYEYAAAFFILGGKLKDAVNLCLRYLKDPALAFLICRCSEGVHGEVAQGLIRSHILPSAINTGDREITSMMLWWLSEKSLSISSLSCPLEWLCQQLSPKMNASPEVKSPASLSIYLRFKNIPINLRKDLAPQNTQDEGDLFLRTATSYEGLGMITLALYVLSKWDVVEENSSALDWGPGTSKKAVQLDDPAIHSGQIDFDDWSWGGATTNRKPTQSLFESYSDSKETERETEPLPSSKLQVMRSFQKSILLKMCQEVMDSLRISKVPGLLPKALVYSYLDTVKSGIQHVCRMFQVDEAAFDSSLVQWCCEEVSPLLGFELIFQGILSQELTGQWLTHSLLSQCGLLISMCFNKDINLHYRSASLRTWIYTALRDYSRWSVALRLTGQSSVTTPHLQAITTVLLSVHLLVLIKERDYSRLLSLLKNWTGLVTSIKNDLNQFDSLIELALKDDGKEVHRFDKTAETRWDLDFDLGDDLQIKYKDSTTPQAQLESKCESMPQEVGLFCDIFDFSVAELARLILGTDSDPTQNLVTLNPTLLEPLIRLNQTLRSLRESVADSPEDKTLTLPPLLEAPQEMIHDSFLLATYFSQIRLFLVDRGCPASRETSPKVTPPDLK